MYILRDNILSTEIEWDEIKNALLKRRRGICFEEIVEALAREGPIWVKEHPRPEKYPGQKLLAVLAGGYVFVVPFEENDEKIILKTIYPSRRATKEQKNQGEKMKAKSSRKDFFGPLDEQERDIRDAVEKGAFVPVADEEELKEKLVRAARATLAKSRHISIRLSEKDLMLLRAKALELGLPYQTLIGSILHQYAEGKVKASF